MTFNQQLIEKARKGEIAILNDGSVEELQSLLKEVWPLDTVIPEGVQKYYLRLNDEKWDGRSYTDLNHHSIKDFFMTDTKEPEIVWDSESFVKDDRPRTYKVTRQQMKEIWEASKQFVTDEHIMGLTKNLFGIFSDAEELTQMQVKHIVAAFPTQQIPDLLKSIFPEYFFIPEGEPVLYKCDKHAPYRIGVSNGNGHVFLDHQTTGLTLTVHCVIPFTKNPQS